jgi:diaminohydroxyphosphoribosylaminopyrimidine deaminase/5-amino-6-(5-phosphoribosylamino)uracil reductase
MSRLPSSKESYMRLALQLAKRGYGRTSPNPMVGAVLVKAGRIIGTGWHHKAGEPHAEIEALRDASRKGASTVGSTLYVTLEPCSTFGRTPPCTDAIVAARIAEVFVAGRDPNPAHQGRGIQLLKRKGVRVTTGVLEQDALRVNEAFNHWIVNGTPFITVKAAMTLDGKIATASGESKWITGPAARRWAMRLREGHDAILVGVNTVLKDNPQLTVRSSDSKNTTKCPLRVVLDSGARTPLTARIVSDEFRSRSLIVISRKAPKARVQALARRAELIEAPEEGGQIDLQWLLRFLGKGEITSLLVEGGGEVNASFLFGGLANRVAFFYAPKVLGGQAGIKSVAGNGATRSGEILDLTDVEHRRLGGDLLMTALVKR